MLRPQGIGNVPARKTPASRILFRYILFLAAAFALDAFSGAHAATWCAQYFNGTTNCYFTSQGQCQGSLAASAAAATPIRPQARSNNRSLRSEAGLSRSATQKRSQPLRLHAKNPFRSARQPNRQSRRRQRRLSSNHRSHSLRSNRSKPPTHSARRGRSFSPGNMKTASPPCLRSATTTILTSR